MSYSYFVTIIHALPPTPMTTQTWTKGSEWALHVGVKQTLPFYFLSITIIHA